MSNKNHNYNSYYSKPKEENSEQLQLFPIEPEVTEEEINIEPEITEDETNIEPEVIEGETNIEPEVIEGETNIEPEVTEGETNIEPEVTEGETNIEPEVTEEEIQNEQLVRVIPNLLNIRFAAEKDAMIVTVVSEDDELILLDKEPINGFYHIITKTGIEGYCMVEFVELV